jgi:uncharacterized membrane protein
MQQILDTATWLGDQWWFWTIGGVLVVGLIAAFFILRSRQSKED